MNYLILVNKDNPLPNDYKANDLVETNSIYKNGIFLDRHVYFNFIKLKNDMFKHKYLIDIMSGYRDIKYQEHLYNESILSNGFAYTLRSIAKPGVSEHHTGLALDVCIYRNNKCYIEHDLEGMEEIEWLTNNCHKYGFIIRYPLNKEHITGYNYEPWHLRYVGDVAYKMYKDKLTLEEYYLKEIDKNVIIK